MRLQHRRPLDRFVFVFLCVFPTTLVLTKKALLFACPCILYMVREIRIYRHFVSIFQTIFTPEKKLNPLNLECSPFHSMAQALPPLPRPKKRKWIVWHLCTHTHVQKHKNTSISHQIIPAIIRSKKTIIVNVVIIKRVNHQRAHIT